MRRFVHSFDARLTTLIQSWPAWLNQPMRAITDTGQPLTVVIFAIAIGVWALWQDQYPMAHAAGIVLATVIISSVLKVILRRARPETEYAAAMIFKTFSFPSGHAAAATVGFGFLAFLTFSLLTWPLSLLLGSFIILYALLICISRVYLGAHFPSDVIGGMLLGISGLAIIYWIIQPLA